MGQSTTKLLKEFDYFGVQFNFSYTSKEKYRTPIGGIGFIIFLIIALSYSFISLIPLIKREKMSVIYYSMQLSQPDEMNFKDYHNNFALGISRCTKLQKNLTEFWDYFTLEFQYITQTNINGKIEKQIEMIPIGKCSYSDLNQNLNESFISLGLDSYYCMKKIDFTIEGTSTSETSKYIKIELKAKNEDPDTFTKIKEILRDECDLNIYIVNTAFDLSNFDFPVKKFLSTQYVNIKYTEMTKRNFFLQLQTFASFENLLFDLAKKQTEISTGSTELYSVFKNNDRFESKIYDFNTFVKIYVRPDLQRTIIERRYMKLTEFASDVSSVLSAVLIVIFVVITFVNKFYANEAVMRKIFQFHKDSHNVGIKSRKTMGDTFLNLLCKFNFNEDNAETKEK